MIDPVEKKAAYRAMGRTVPESDVDRLAAAARMQGLRARAEADGTLGDGDTYEDLAELAELSDALADHGPSARDFVFVTMFFCLGVFTRIWTNIAVGYDYDGNVGLFTFAIAVVLVLHAVILAVAFGAWRSAWQHRGRTFMAMAALAGYLATHVLSWI